MSSPKIDRIGWCAEVLFSITKNWKVDEGATSLSEARTVLAKMIYVSDGEGFPDPEQATDNQLEAWKDCIKVAKANETSDSKDLPYTHAIFWEADPEQSSKSPLKFPAKWPYSVTSKVVSFYGPITDSKNIPKWLFLFNDVDRENDIDSSPGFWPRNYVTSNQAKIKRRPHLATVLFVLSIVVSLYVVNWLVFAGDQIHKTWDYVYQITKDIEYDKIKIKDLENTIKDKGSDKTKNEQETITALNEKLNKLESERILTTCITKNADPWTAECNNAWLQIWETTKPTANSTWCERLRVHFWQSAPLNLFVPFVAAMLAVVLLVMAAGLGIHGQWFGALIDVRYRYSLSQTQQVAWTILLLPAVSVVACFNSSLMQLPISNVTELIPTLSLGLWLALGINIVASPYMSVLILGAKEANIKINHIIKPSSLDKNDNPGEASWLDLITSEVEGLEGQIDISRLQHLIISGILLSVYFVMMVEMLSGISNAILVKSMVANLPPFPNLPPVGQTFVILLGLSHGSYLLFKAQE